MALFDTRDPPDTRLQRRRAVLIGAAALALPPALRAAAAPRAVAGGGRLTADFEPTAAVWLGHDAGHEAFTVALARALLPHAPLKLLVRDDDAEAQARALLRQHGLDLARVQVVQHPQAIFFVRDAAVFARDAGGALGVVDFRWTHYGWPVWCRRRHGRDAAAMQACISDDGQTAGGLDRGLAAAAQASVWRSALAMEGGGLEHNGAGLLIVNDALWASRNPQLTDADLQRELLRLPGVRRLVRLPAGLAHDPLHRATITGRHVAWGTGGHTDEFVRFADERTVLLAWPDEAEAARHPVARLNLQRMQRNHRILVATRDLQGRPLRVLKVPMPTLIERPVRLTSDADLAHSGQWSPEVFGPAERRRAGDVVQQVAVASYLNHVVANGVVLLPDYVPHGTPPARQAQVRQLYEAAFPGRQVQFIDAIGANWVGGGAHCATLNEPVV